MSFKASLGITPSTNCLIASKAISLFESDSMFSKKEEGSGLISSGKYKPLSGAMPRTTASSKPTFGAFPFKL